MLIVNCLLLIVFLLAHDDVKNSSGIADADLAVAVGVGSLLLEVARHVANDVVQDGGRIANADLAVAVRIAWQVVFEHECGLDVIQILVRAARCGHVASGQIDGIRADFHVVGEGDVDRGNLSIVAREGGVAVVQRAGYVDRVAIDTLCRNLVAQGGSRWQTVCAQFPVVDGRAFRQLQLELEASDGIAVLESDRDVHRAADATFGFLYVDGVVEGRDVGVGLEFNYVLEIFPPTCILICRLAASRDIQCATSFIHATELVRRYRYRSCILHPDRAQVGAIRERMRENAGHAAGDGYRAQAAAPIERIKANASHAAGDGYRAQAAAPIERPTANTGHAAGDGYRDQAGAIPERTFANAGHAAGDGYRDQAGASREHIFANAGDGNRA